MEIIRLEGYTEDEKVEIAERHLIAKQIEAHGLKHGEFELTDEGLRDLIRYYTREAGVRTLEREIAKLARKALRQILERQGRSSRSSRPTISATSPACGSSATAVGEEEDQIGAVTGSRLDRGRRRVADDRERHRAGQGRDQDDRQARRGDDRESSRPPSASSRRARRPMASSQPIFQRKDIHIHLPEGAVPKDGPSAGVGMVTSIVSTLTGIPVRARRRDDRRGDAARPGAADRRAQGKAARGAARRHQDRADPGGEREGSRRDSRRTSRKGSRSSRSSHVDEVLALALTDSLEPIDWTEADELAAQPPQPGCAGAGPTGIRCVTDRLVRSKKHGFRRGFLAECDGFALTGL